MFGKGKVSRPRQCLRRRNRGGRLVGKGAIDLYLPQGAQIVRRPTCLQGPLLPPVKEGEQLAQLNVMCDGCLVQVTPLFAGEMLHAGDIVRKATDALKELTLGWL